MDINEAILDAGNKILTFVKTNVPEGTVVDDTLDTTSTHAIANKPVAEALESLNTTVDNHTQSLQDMVDDILGLKTEDALLSGRITTNSNDIHTLSGTIGTETARLSGLITSGVTEAKGYADTQDSATLTAAKNYTDSKAPSIVGSNGISVTMSGIYAKLAGDYGAIDSANTNKPVTGATLKEKFDALPQVIFDTNYGLKGISNSQDHTLTGRINLATNSGLGFIVQSGESKLKVDTTVIQPKLTAGNGIDITSATISADFGNVETANTTKPVTGKAVKDYVDAAAPNITAGNGIDVDTSTPGTTSVSAKIETNKGLALGSNGLSVKAGKGISIDSNGVNAVLPTSDPGVNNVLWISL